MPDSSYDDRQTNADDAWVLPKPQIEVIVDGNSVFKPGMKTYFVGDYDSSSGKFDAAVAGTYCSCDTVTTTRIICTCEHVCTCESVCTCVSYTSGGTGGRYCSCVPVH